MKRYSFHFTPYGCKKSKKMKKKYIIECFWGFFLLVFVPNQLYGQYSNAVSIFKSSEKLVRDSLVLVAGTGAFADVLCRYHYSFLRHHVLHITSNDKPRKQKPWPSRPLIHYLPGQKRPDFWHPALPHAPEICIWAQPNDTAYFGALKKQLPPSTTIYIAAITPDSNNLKVPCKAISYHFSPSLSAWPKNLCPIYLKKIDQKKLPNRAAGRFQKGRMLFRSSAEQLLRISPFQTEEVQSKLSHLHQILERMNLSSPANELSSFAGAWLLEKQKTLNSVIRHHSMVFARTLNDSTHISIGDGIQIPMELAVFGNYHIANLTILPQLPSNWTYRDFNQNDILKSFQKNKYTRFIVDIEPDSDTFKKQSRYVVSVRILYKLSVPPSATIPLEDSIPFIITRKNQ